MANLCVVLEPRVRSSVALTRARATPSCRRGCRRRERRRRERGTSRDHIHVRNVRRARAVRRGLSRFFCARFVTCHFFVLASLDVGARLAVVVSETRRSRSHGERGA